MSCPNTSRPVTATSEAISAAIPIGVGRIDGLVITSEGVLAPGRLDYLGYQFIAAEAQALAEAYANGEIGLDALKQGILVQGNRSQRQPPYPLGACDAPATVVSGRAPGHAARQ